MNTQALHDARDVLTNLIAAQTKEPPIQSNLTVVLAEVRAVTPDPPDQVVLRIVDEETARTVTTVTAARLQGWLTKAATADHGQGISREVQRHAADLLRDDAAGLEQIPPPEVLMQRLCRKVRELQVLADRQATTLGDIANLAGGTE